MNVIGVLIYLMNNKSMLFVADLHLEGRHLYRLDSLKSDFDMHAVSLRSFARPYGLLDRFFIKLGFPLPDFPFSLELYKKLAQKDFAFDIVWLDKAERLSLLDFILLLWGKMRHPLINKIVWFHEDQIFSRPERNMRYSYHLRIADEIFTTKANVFNHLKREKVTYRSNIELIPNLVFEVSEGPLEQKAVEEVGDVLFIGAYEKHRANMLQVLAEEGVSVRVHGNGWKNKLPQIPNLLLSNHLELRMFRIVCGQHKVCINFFRRTVQDTMTTRPLEYAIAGGCILSEFSEELASVLQPEVDAVYFSDQHEMVSKVKRLKENQPLRQLLRTNARIRASQYMFNDYFIRRLRA